MAILYSYSHILELKLNKKIKYIHLRSQLVIYNLDSNKNPKDMLTIIIPQGVSITWGGHSPKSH